METIMKRTILVWALLTAAVAFAQNYNLPVEHVIVVFQENRTVTNLFANDTALIANGFHLVKSGRCGSQTIALTSYRLDACFDASHAHTAWETARDTGKMDQFCSIPSGINACTTEEQQGIPSCTVNGVATPCPQYTKVDASQIGPYFQMAARGGFANYMFQTNQGPSFPAHQFLFTGTSGPVKPGDDYDLDFVAELSDDQYGCAQTSNFPTWIEPNGLEMNPINSVGECYAHDSLVTAAADCSNGFCDRGISWGWYQPSGSSIWNAPSANPQSCYGNATPQGGSCPDPSPPQYTEYSKHVHIAGNNGYSDAPIFDDLYGCSLPAISWVIPDMKWSDHAWGPGNPQSRWALGAYWVGDIINGVGTAWNGKYWSGSEPTAVIVTWDDWGGWYDHVSPWAVYESSSSSSCPTTVAPNGWGCGYVSGFRVPLLVVSAYTGTYQNNTYGAYVSGECGASPLLSCPNFGNNNVYVHDFGSILAFTEWNFGMSYITYPDPLYADYNAPDWGPGTEKKPSNTPLLDFFQLTQPRPFVSVDTYSWNYTCFTEWGSNTNCPNYPDTYVAQDPDDD
jgi:phospholipase C